MIPAIVAVRFRRQAHECHPWTNDVEDAGEPQEHVAIATDNRKAALGPDGGNPPQLGVLYAADDHPNR
jgi:hypothetical protein